MGTAIPSRPYCNDREVESNSKVALKSTDLSQLDFHQCLKSQSTSRLYGRDDCHNEYYFRFTRGRFVADEQHEMSQRYVRFDLDELARLAAEAADSKYCISIEKYPEHVQ